MPSSSDNATRPMSNGSGTSSARSGRSLVDVIASGKKCIWNKHVKDTQLEKFKDHIEKKYGLTLGNYWDLHKWSVDNYKTFWSEIWKHFDIICSKTFDESVSDEECFIDVEWFKGARLNFAENILRYRDERVALIYADEEGREAKVTFAELYEKVKIYAAAMRRHGLKKGDCVACYMSNKLEAVYIQLAAACIGAVFGGPSPFYGIQAATHIIQELEPKFLFTVDRFLDEGNEYNLLENVSGISYVVKSLEKVVVIPDKGDCRQCDISSIKNSCFLDQFLLESAGPIPDLVFEQFHCNHPLFVSFTSGTTGKPKGLVHSPSYMFYKLVHYAFHDNVTRDDILMTCLPVGWNVWNGSLVILALGGTLFLFNGTPHLLSTTFFWDVVSKYKVTMTWFVPSTVDKMDKANIIPRNGRIPSHVRRIAMGGSPVKLQNYEYFSRIGHDNLFVGCGYGATETVGTFTGYDLNLPAYSGEMQVPGLGVDMKCLDEDGKEVIGKVGEVVVGKPLPTMPVNFLLSREKVHEIYFSKYKGFWSQNDEGWIDPETRGLVVIGRSDETLNQFGERFGPSEIYSAIHDIDELADYLCVGQSNSEGDQRAILFVKLKKGASFMQDLVEKIKEKIENELDEEFVPQVILEAKDIPYNQNNKRMEKLVKNIIATNTVPKVVNMKNADCLIHYCNIPELQDY